MSADVFVQATPMKRRKLSDEHRRYLIDGSGILPGIVKERGYYSLTSAAIKILVGEKAIREQALSAEAWLGIPIFRPDGTYYGDIIRLFGAPSGTAKYIWPTGQSQVVDIHPRMSKAITDPNVPVFLTEGVKKADAVLSHAMSEGLNVLPMAVNGCWGWMAKTTAGSIACPDFRDVPINKRTIYVNSDSDFRTNDNVRKGWSEAALYFSSKTDDKSKTLIVITPPVGYEKQGVDDYLSAGYSLKDLLSQATTPRLALLENQPGLDDAKPIAFRTGLEIVKSAPAKVPFLMEPIIPSGSINLMAGHSGTYKTWHMLSLALDGAFGYMWGEHPGTKVPTDPFTTIYVNKEMAGSMLDVRLKMLAKSAKYTDNPDYESVLSERIILVEEAELDLNHELQRSRLEELAMGTEAKLIILDSLSMCWTGDENSAQEVGAFYVQMREITERTGVSWALVHHLIKPTTTGKKGSRTSSKFAVRGSGQIIQQADGALLFDRVEMDNPNEPPLIAITHTKTRTTAEMPTWVSAFEDHDGMWSALRYKGLLAERKAAAYTASRGDPAKFAEWAKTALESMPAMHHPQPGLRTKNLIVLLQNSWPDRDISAPSESTIRRHLDSMIASGDIEVLEFNKRLGDLYRLRNEMLVDSEPEDYNDEEYEDDE